MDTEAKIAELEARVASQQIQITELRLILSQKDEREAALIKHWVTQAVHSELEDRLPSKEETMYLTSIFKAAVQRAKDRNDLMMHFVKWGLGGTVAFFLYAGWGSVKVMLGFKGQ
jgi:uncharacterized coiled-coil protein SlyX